MDGADRIDLHGYRGLDHVHLLCFVIRMSAEQQFRNADYSFILNVDAHWRVLCTDPDSHGTVSHLLSADTPYAQRRAMSSLTEVASCLQLRANHFPFFAMLLVFTTRVRERTRGGGSRTYRSENSFQRTEKSIP